MHLPEFHHPLRFITNLPAIILWRPPIVAKSLMTDKSIMNYPNALYLLIPLTG
jgi:hypothetical protein